VVRITVGTLVAIAEVFAVWDVGKRIFVNGAMCEAVVFGVFGFAEIACGFVHDKKWEDVRRPVKDTAPNAHRRAASKVESRCNF